MYLLLPVVTSPFSFLILLIFLPFFLAEIEIMNNLITNTETKTVIKNLPKNKSPGPDGFPGEFYKTFREELMPIFLKLSQKTSEEGTLTNSFYKARITLIPKPGKDNMKKRNLEANITDEHG